MEMLQNFNDAGGGKILKGRVYMQKSSAEQNKLTSLHKMYYRK